MLSQSVELYFLIFPETPSWPFLSPGRSGKVFCFHCLQRNIYCRSNRFSGIIILYLYIEQCKGEPYNLQTVFPPIPRTVRSSVSVGYNNNITRMFDNSYTINNAHTRTHACYMGHRSERLYFRYVIVRIRV